MAPATRRRKKKKALAVAPPPPLVTEPAADHLSKLPEEILAQILSFLPAQEAIRTCVLARTWRDVWKSTRRLRITGDSVREVRGFVDRLLRVRVELEHTSRLEASEITFDPSEEFVDVDELPYIEPYLDDKDTSSLNGWIRRVLECQIQMLRVDIDAQGYLDAYLQMWSRHRPLVSPHLTRLELTDVWLVCRRLDLDSCPALEHLEINECCLAAVRKITSLSLRRLVITSCDSWEDQKRIRICVPRLVSLWLDHNSVRTPWLERMPELVGAKVRINSSLDDCHCEYPMSCYHVMQDGDISDSDSDSGDDEEGSCVVLEGLAQAKDLVLIADRPTFIFRRDLKWCPVFSNLKMLVLNHDFWCQPADCSALACILEHAPLLEKLTLVPHQVLPARGKYKVEMKGHPDATAKSNKISQHLMIVEFNCEDVNGIFLNVLNFFGALNIYFEIKVTKNDEGTTISLN